MTNYTLIIKDTSLVEDREAHVERWLNEHIYNGDFSWHIHYKGNFETVVIVSAPTYVERMFQAWYAKPSVLHRGTGYPVGTLLAWSRVDNRLVALDG
jgi:hypothetical protein